MKYKFHDHTIVLDFFSWVLLRSYLVQKWSCHKGKSSQQSHWEGYKKMLIRIWFIGETKISLVWFPPNEESRINNETESQIHRRFEKACCIMSRRGKNRTGLSPPHFYYYSGLLWWAPIWHQDKFLQVSVDQLLTRSYSFTMWSLPTVSKCESDVSGLRAHLVHVSIVTFIKSCVQHLEHFSAVKL